MHQYKGNESGGKSSGNSKKSWICCENVFTENYTFPRNFSVNSTVCINWGNRSPEPWILYNKHRTEKPEPFFVDGSKDEFLILSKSNIFFVSRNFLYKNLKKKNSDDARLLLDTFQYIHIYFYTPEPTLTTNKLWNASCIAPRLPGNIHVIQFP